MRPKVRGCHKEDCEYMKILYLTPDFENFFAATYHGMIHAIEPYCDVIYYGPGHENFDDLGSSRDILAVIDKLYGGANPDVILMWDIEGSGWAGDFTNLEKTNSLKVLWSVDIQNDAVPHRMPFIETLDIGLVLMTYDKDQITHSARTFQTLGCPIEFYPFSVDPDRFTPMGLPKKWDASLIGNMSSSYYPLRNAVHRALSGKPLNYHHPTMGIFVKDEFARHINESKICVTGSSSYKYLVQKYYEVTACGTLLMADMCMDAEHQGFIPGENFVEISADNVVEKVEYYLNHLAERNRIAKNGRDLILQRHTHDIRARELMEILHKYV